MDHENQFDIIVTLNTTNIKPVDLIKFVGLGVTIFRINGSFLNEEDIQGITALIKKNCEEKVKILLDLPGFKPRFSYLREKINYKPDVPVQMDINCINYPEIIKILEAGDTIRINDGMVKFKIVAIDGDEIIFLPDRSGTLRRGKGFYLEKKGYRPSINCLSDLDIKLIEIAQKNGVDYIGLSFVHNLDDLKFVEKYLWDDKIKCIPKIEARESLENRNLISIMAKYKKIIVDRGDMSGEVGMENIWWHQRKIVEKAKLLNCRTIMATQFFSYMINNPIPSIAEADSFYDLLQQGINGIQLSEETCVGKNGPEIVKLIMEGVGKVYNKKIEGRSNGKVIWIMGPTSSGKTTIAEELSKRLFDSNQQSHHIDGDEVRALFGSDLGFRPQDRLKVVKTIVHFANKSIVAGDTVIVSALTANEDAREYIKENFENICIVYLDCPMEECIKRDPKGLYKKAIDGEIDTMVGVNSKYLPPERIDFSIDTCNFSISECVDELILYLLREKVL